MRSIIQVVLLVVSLLLPTQVLAGTCRHDAPKNQCGPCRAEGACGGSDRSRFCLAEPHRRCVQQATRPPAPKLVPKPTSLIEPTRARQATAASSALEAPGDGGEPMLTATLDSATQARHELAAQQLSGPYISVPKRGRLGLDCRCGRVSEHPCGRSHHSRADQGLRRPAGDFGHFPIFRQRRCRAL